MIDDIIIFTIAMKTLKLTGISTKYNKFSHLIGGIIMLLIGILMILKPEWLMFNFKHLFIYIIIALLLNKLYN